MPHYGTDLFVETPLGQDRLIDVLSRVLSVARADVFLAPAVEAEPAMAAAFLDAFGERNVVRLHRLRQLSGLTFKIDLAWTGPIPCGLMQSLAEAVAGVVALSRDTAFPEEVGTLAGEGHVIFRPDLTPAAGALVTRRDRHGEETYDWTLLDEPLPATRFLHRPDG